MEIKYTDYEINLKDIIDYERSMIILGKTSDRLGVKILNKIDAVIFDNREPVFGLKDYKPNDKYYRDYKKVYEEALSDVVERFKLNFFFVNGDCFEYGENIIINKPFKDFCFWFVLKLRQYEFRLSKIKSFLNFQLETNFNNDKNEFVDFLKSKILKNQNELLKNEIIDTVNQLIENNFDDKLILKIKYDKSILFNALKEYFDSKDYNELNQLLNEEEIQDKICFRSNANQFVMLLRQLHLNQKIIGQWVNTEKWICKYFTYFGQNKKNSHFDPDNVHKILTKYSYDIPKSKRIDLPDLKYIKDKSK